MTIGLNLCMYLNLSGDNEISQRHIVEVPVRVKQIITEMSTKAISKMATSTAAGPSCLVAEILKPIWEADRRIAVRDLIEDIMSEGCIETT